MSKLSCCKMSFKIHSDKSIAVDCIDDDNDDVDGEKEEEPEDDEDESSSSESSSSSQSIMTSSSIADTVNNLDLSPMVGHLKHQITMQKQRSYRKLPRDGSNQSIVL